MTVLNIHLLSDSTGDTVYKIAEAVLSQFADLQVREFFWPLLRTGAPLEKFQTGLAEHGGIVIATFADPALAEQVRKICAEAQVPFVSALDPIFALIGRHLNQKLSGTPGKQHELNAEYFARIAAIDFALAHDDGQARADLQEAQVVLIGVSRTSKTPTCVYLSHRGIKAANVPLVPGIDLPPELVNLRGPLIVGLTHDPERLAQIRQSRLQMLGEFTGQNDYADIDRVRQELLDARKLFARMGWPVIDVTRRSVEETAAMILQMLQTVDG
jgi:regulator of PEP synthase PpsR (kinase-PPPase family)